MTVAELLDELNNAIGRGLSPDTTVTIYDESTDNYYLLVEVDDPTTHTGTDLWLTLFTGREADSFLDMPARPLNPEWHAIVTAAQIRADNERRA